MVVAGGVQPGDLQAVRLTEAHQQGRKLGLAPVGQGPRQVPQAVDQGPGLGCGIGHADAGPVGPRRVGPLAQPRPGLAVEVAGQRVLHVVALGPRVAHGLAGQGHRLGSTIATGQQGHCQVAAAHVHAVGVPGGGPGGHRPALQGDAGGRLGRPQQGALVGQDGGLQALGAGLAGQGQGLVQPGRGARLPLQAPQHMRHPGQHHRPGQPGGQRRGGRAGHGLRAGQLRQGLLGQLQGRAGLAGQQPGAGQAGPRDGLLHRVVQPVGAALQGGQRRRGQRDRAQRRLGGAGQRCGLAEGTVGLGADQGRSQVGHLRPYLLQRGGQRQLPEPADQALPMALAQRRLVFGRQHAGGKFADQLEHRVAVAPRLGAQHRVRHQRLQRQRGLDGRALGQRHGGVQREAGGHHRQPRQQLPGGGRQQLPAPAHHRQHRRMARVAARPRAAAGQQAQPRAAAGGALQQAQQGAG